MPGVSSQGSTALPRQTGQLMTDTAGTPPMNRPLPSGLMRSSQPGALYSPDCGEHSGHIVELLSRDGIRHNIMREPLQSWLVRCHDCLQSWTFPPEDGRD